MSDLGIGQLRPMGREPVPDVAQPCEVMHIAGQRGHFGHRHLGVERGEAVTRALLAGEQLHALGVQPQQACRELVDGPLHMRLWLVRGCGVLQVRDGGGAFVWSRCLGSG